MKKIPIIFLAVLLLTVSAPALADEISIDLDVYSYNQMAQMQGGGGGQSETTIRSYIQPLAGGTEFLQISPVWKPHEKKPYYVRPYSEIDDLYTLPQVEQRVKTDGDIVQKEGICRPLEYNEEPVHYLPGLPVGYNDREIWSVTVDSPPNGKKEETIKRALSFAKWESFTRRVYVEIELQLNPNNAGSVLPGGSGSSFIGGTTAWAFAANAQTGESNSRVHNVWKVTVHCYNDGYVPPFNPLKPPVGSTGVKRSKTNGANQEIATYVIYGSDYDPGDMTQKAAIEKNMALLASKWPDIIKEGLRVDFVGWYSPGYNEEIAEEFAHKIYLEIGTDLYDMGIKENELYSILSYDNQPVPDEKNLQRLKARNSPYAVVVKVYKT
jgi:hypothetical protein